MAQLFKGPIKTSNCTQSPISIYTISTDTVLVHICTSRYDYILQNVSQLGDNHAGWHDG